MPLVDDGDPSFELGPCDCVVGCDGDATCCDIWNRVIFSGCGGGCVEKDMFAFGLAKEIC